MRYAYVLKRIPVLKCIKKRWTISICGEAKGLFSNRRIYKKMHF